MAGAASPTTKVTRADIVGVMNAQYLAKGGFTSEASKARMRAENQARIDEDRRLGRPVTTSADAMTTFAVEASKAAVAAGSPEKIDAATRARLMSIIGLAPTSRNQLIFEQVLQRSLGVREKVANQKLDKIVDEAKKKGEALDEAAAKTAAMVKSTTQIHAKSGHRCANPPCIVSYMMATEADAKLKKCSRCLKVRYCSSECQRADWRAHKLDCKAPDPKAEASSTSSA